MNKEERLELISEMIAVSRGKFQKSSFYFLFWGIVICLTNITHFVLLEYSNYDYPYYVWLITIPAVVITIFYSIKQDRSAQASTYLDKTIGLLWASYAVSLFVIVAFGYKINFQINAVILAMTSVPTLVTGAILRFKPLVIGGIFFILFSIIAFLTEYMSYQFLIAAFAIAIGYLIPGILLKRNESKHGI